MPNALVLPAELTIYAVGELRPTWLQWINRNGGDWRVDGAAVAEVDGAGIQMLLALAHSAAAERQPFVVENPSETLATACRTMGLQELIAGGANA